MLHALVVFAVAVHSSMAAASLIRPSQCLKNYKQNQTLTEAEGTACAAQCESLFERAALGHVERDLRLEYMACFRLQKMWQEPDAEECAQIERRAAKGMLNDYERNRHIACLSR